ncbi:MAG: hypothetical protein EOP10_12070 [Proteobacteria bacterium]|nr:MAG: hypothetical protein EOP10_12070 [Pseudomonadota bacterium]
MQNLGRKLGGMERLFYQQNLVGSGNLTSILFFEGTIDLEEIPKALLRLQIAFPSLTNRIVADPKLRFVVGSGILPYEVIERQDDEHFRRLARSEVRRQYSDTRIHFTFLVGPDKGEIIVAADHVLADAKSLYALCELFIEAMHGRELSYVPMGDAWENRLPKEYRGLAGIVKTYRFIKKIFAGSPEIAMKFGHDVDHVHTESFGFKMDKSILKDLKANTDRHQSNLNSIFCAAAVLAAHEIYRNKEPGIVCLNTPVSVRDQIVPPAAPEEMGMFISAFLQWHKLDENTDIWELARNILATIKSGVGAGEALMLGKLAAGPKKPEKPKPDKNRQRFTQSITVSNPGRLVPFKNLPDAKIVGYRNLGSLWTQESITVVVLGYGDYLYVDAEISVERLGHFPKAAENLADGIRQRILAAAQPNA